MFPMDSNAYLEAFHNRPEFASQCLEARMVTSQDYMKKVNIKHFKHMAPWEHQSLWLLRNQLRSGNEDVGQSHLKATSEWQSVRALHPGNSHAKEGSCKVKTKQY